MARMPTWEEMQKDQGVPVEMSPLELRVDALERNVQTLMDMLMAATVTVHPAPKPAPDSMLCKEIYGHEDQYGKQVSPEEYEVQAHAEKAQAHAEKIQAHAEKIRRGY